jgi:type II secretory pathway component PulF
MSSQGEHPSKQARPPAGAVSSGATRWPVQAPLTYTFGTPSERCWRRVRYAVTNLINFGLLALIALPAVANVLPFFSATTILLLMVILAVWAGCYALVRLLEAFVRGPVLRAPHPPLNRAAAAFLASMAFGTLASCGNLDIPVCTALCALQDCFSSGMWSYSTHLARLRDVPVPSWSDVLVGLLLVALGLAFNLICIFRPVPLHARSDRQRWIARFTIALTVVAGIFTLLFWVWRDSFAVLWSPVISPIAGFMQLSGVDSTLAAAPVVPFLLIIAPVAILLASAPFAPPLPLSLYKRLSELPRLWSAQTWATLISFSMGVFAFILRYDRYEMRPPNSVLLEHLFEPTAPYASSGVALGPATLLAMEWLLSSLTLILIYLYLLRPLLLRRDSGWRALFYDHTATALEADLPVRDAVASFLHTQLSSYVRGRFGRLLYDLDHGVALEAALARLDDVFPPSEVALIAASDSDSLPATLRYLARALCERQHALRSRNWPMVTTLEAVPLFCLLIFLATLFVPRMQSILGLLDARLPRFSGIVFGSLQWLVGWWLWVLMAIIIVRVGVRLLMRHVATARRIAGWLIYPMRDLLWLPQLANLSQSLSLQLRRCVPLDQALPPAIEAAGDPVLSDRAPELLASVERGNPLHVAFLSVAVVPQWFASHLALGARLENLPDVLAALAADYQRRAARLSTTLRSVVGSLYLLGMALCVVAVVVAFYLVIFSMSSYIPCD